MAAISCEGAAAVEALQSGRYRAVDATFLTLPQIRQAAKALRDSDKVEVFGLRFTTFDRETLEAFAEDVAQNGSLTSFTVTGAELKDSDAPFLATALRDNKALKEVNFYDNQFGPHGARLLCDALIEHSSASLTMLSFETNALGDEAMPQLASALGKLKLLSSLYLGQNDISAEGIKALAPAVASHPSMRLLDLVGNTINDNGAKLLADMLKTASLQSLNLSQNPLEATSYEHFAAVMATNTKLLSLHLEGQGKGDSAAKAFEKALEPNKFSCLVDLQGVTMTNRLKKLLLRNRKNAGDAPGINMAQLDAMTASNSKGCIVM